MGDYVSGGIKQQFKYAQKQADSDFDKAIKNQESIDATTKKLKEVDKALIDDFMKGLIHYILSKEREKHK